ncbi:MAG: hypothetical protein K2J82_12220 [Muribaculaceae bacterium]|nr:hypothetical protein [Muribaculaceae bacterium]
MIRILLLSVIVLLSAFSASADGDKKKSKQEMFKEILEFKMKYLAQEMDLKGDQRQKFFDLYSEMTQRKNQCWKNARHMEKKLRKNDNPSEADYQAVTDAMNKAKAEDATIENEYSDKFSSFLTQKQIFKMKEAEDSFRKKMEEMRRKNHHKEKK